MRLPIILPNEEQLSHIRSSLSIDEDRYRRKLEVFKDWLKSERHLPDDVDDSYLSQLLRLCKGDLERAKKKFETNIIMRKSIINNKPFLSKKVLESKELGRQCVVLPKLTEDGYRLIFAQFPKSVKTFDLRTTLQYVLHLNDITTFEDFSAGIIHVSDYTNCSMELISKMDLALVNQFRKLFVDGFATRVKNFHILNLPSSAKPFFALINAGLPEKLKRRIVIHGNVQNLKNYICEDLLPSDFDGKLPCLEELSRTWEKFYVEDENWKNKVRKLRLTGDIPKAKLHLDPDSGFGTDGTFRNLQVD